MLKKYLSMSFCGVLLESEPNGLMEICSRSLKLVVISWAKAKCLVSYRFLYLTDDSAIGDCSQLDSCDRCTSRDDALNQTRCIWRSCDNGEWLYIHIQTLYFIYIIPALSFSLYCSKRLTVTCDSLGSALGNSTVNNLSAHTVMAAITCRHHPQ